MIAQNVAEIISRHVKLTVEGIDRMYLNVFVPGLQYEQGIIRFFRHHRGQPLPSAALMSPMTRSFVTALEDFVARQEVALVQSSLRRHSMRAASDGSFDLAAIRLRTTISVVSGW